MPDSSSLSVEQNLTLRILKDHIKTLSREDAIQELIKLHRQMMIRDSFHQQQRSSSQTFHRYNNALTIQYPQKDKSRGSIFD